MQEKLFPLDAKVNKVLGVLSLLAQNNGKLKLSYLARLSKSNLDNMLAEVNAAKMIGLVTVSGDLISLTGLGNELHDNVAGVKKKIRDRLREIEPFKSAYNMTKEKGYIVGNDIVDRIAKKGIYLQTDPKKSKALIDTALLQWGIMFGVISYNGKERVWGKAD
jgi:hypothetical protein